MNKTKNDLIVSALIDEGNKYDFDNNKYYAYGEVFSRATTEFLSWVSKVEDFISSNYSESSGPYKMLQSVNKAKFSGYYKYEFDAELTKLKGAIKSCENLKPNRITTGDKIIELIKNPFFWTVLVIGISASYKLGFDNECRKLIRRWTNPGSC